MNNKTKQYLPFIRWITEIAEEKINEHRFIRKKFESYEEFIVFTIIWIRVYRTVQDNVKKDNSTLSLDKFLKNFYNKQSNQYLGITINAVSRESNIPRTTVKRMIEKLINKKYAKRNQKQLIVPTADVRELMKEYRKYIFSSHQQFFKLFSKFDIENLYNEEDKF